jgi:hypothetical protein
MLITRCKDTYFFPNCKEIHDFFRILSPEMITRTDPVILIYSIFINEV